MRHLTAFIIMIFCTTYTYSQTYEIGGFVGGANYIGDVGNSSYINPNSLVGGLLFKWNRSDRHSFRFSLLHAEINADDANSDEPRRQQRGYDFTNNITEASLGIEYTFWEWNLHNGKRQAVPYLYTGLTGFYANQIFLDGTELKRGGDNVNIAIPAVIGFKATIGRHLIAGVEFGARYTFTDNLDGSNPEELDSNGNAQPFGNINTNDWYVFTGITLTYSFGRKPCYCNF
jgi:hypothetical protein